MESKILKGLRNASYLAIGNTISTIIQFFLLVYIVRMLSPEDYGKWVIIITFVGFFEIFGLSGMNKVLIREGSKNINEMSNVLEEMVGIRHIFSLISVLVCILSLVFVGYDSVVKLYIASYSIILILANFRPFIGSIFKASEDFKNLVKINLISKLIYSSTIFLLLYFGFGIKGMLIGSLFVEFIALLVRYSYSRRLVKFNLISKLVLNKELFKQSFTFSILTFFGSLAVRLDLLMVSFLSSPTDVAIYAVAYKLVSQLNMLRNVNADAFFPIIVKRVQEGPIRFRTLALVCTFFLITISLVLYLFSLYVDLFIVYLFGEDYRYSATIVLILLAYQGINWFYMPFGLLMQATHNEDLGLYINPFKALLNIPLNIYLFYQYGLIGIAYSSFLVAILGALLGIFLIYRRVKNQGHVY